MESAYGHTVRRDILLFGYSRNDSETGGRKSRGRRDWKKSGIDYGSVPSRHSSNRRDILQAVMILVRPVLLFLADIEYRLPFPERKY